MSERTILVCDTCGKPAAETVTIKASRGNFAKDLCATHVNDLLSGARKPRPGRPRAVVAGTAPRPARSAAKSASAPRKRGRPRKKPA